MLIPSGGGQQKGEAKLTCTLWLGTNVGGAVQRVKHGLYAAFCGPRTVNQSLSSRLNPLSNMYYTQRTDVQCDGRDVAISAPFQVV